MWNTLYSVNQAPPYDDNPTCSMGATSLNAGSTLTLTCNSAGGVEPASLKWKEGERFLRMGPGTEGYLDDNNRGSMKLVHSFRVDKSENGKQFTCTAENTAITLLHERGDLPTDSLMCTTQILDVKCE